MKIGFTMHNKLKMAFLLMVVFLGLLIRNFVDKKNDSELETSFNSVYKDRLLVEGYIYEIANSIHTKKMLINSGYSADISSITLQELERQNQRISDLIVAYEKTKLTKEEAFQLVAMKNNLYALNKSEHAYMNRMKYNYDATDLKLKMSIFTDNTLLNLNKLSSIQLAVGKDMNDNSQKILSESSVFSQFSIALLIVIGLIIQMLIFNSEEKLIKRIPDVQAN